MFIGAPSFLTLNVIIVPTMAFILGPVEAFSAALIGGVISLYVFPAQAMFGLFTILLPVAGATFGSLAVNKGKMGKIIASAFLVIAISAYLVVNSRFPYFVAPHTLALVILVIMSLRELSSKELLVPLYAFVATMCEQGMMMIFAVHMLGLPWGVFTGILPVMLYERIVATIGATILTLAINRALPSFVRVSS